MNPKVNYLIISLLLIAILFIGIITRNTTKLITDKTIENHQQSIAAEAAKTVALWLQQQMKIIDATADAIEKIPIKEDRQNLQLLRMAMDAGNFSDVYIGLTDGTMIDGALWTPPENYDPRLRPWYHKAMADKRTAFTKPYQDMTTGKMVIAIVRPLWVRDTPEDADVIHEGADVAALHAGSASKDVETIRGVISGDVILNTLEESVLNVRIGKSGYAFIIDSNGTILIHPEHEKQMREKMQESDPTLRNILYIFSQTASGSYTYEYLGEEKILSYQRLPDSGWYLCTTVQKEEAYILAKHTAMLFAMDLVFKILGLLVLLTTLLAVCSAAVILISKNRLATVVREHNEALLVKEKDLKGEIIRRKEVETRYLTLFNMATNAILLIKEELCIECNEKAIELFGLDHEQIIGRSMVDLSPANQQDGEESRIKLDKILLKLIRGTTLVEELEQDSSLNSILVEGDRFSDESIRKESLGGEILNNETLGDETLGDGKPLFFEWIFIRSNGTEFPAEVSLKPIFLDREAVTLCSIWDISRRTNAEQRLRQAQKMAAMGEMLSLIAHQWRQPLNVLSSYIASLTPAFYNGMVTKSFIERVVTESDSQIQFMSRTINDFRDYFRPSKSKHPFDVAQCVRSAAKLMEPQLKKSGITFAMRTSDQSWSDETGELNTLDGGEEFMVLGYKNEFVHVLVNILSNAKDAIEERAALNSLHSGLNSLHSTLNSENCPESEEYKRAAPAIEELRRERNIAITIIGRGSSVCLTIEDTGCGIPDHLLPKIFTPYFTTKGTSTGTGIGLYMAKMIVEKEMQGSITAENHQHGARFMIKLPLS